MADLNVQDFFPSPVDSTTDAETIDFNEAFSIEDSTPVNKPVVQPNSSSDIVNNDVEEIDDPFITGNDQVSIEQDPAQQLDNIEQSLDTSDPEKTLDSLNILVQDGKLNEDERRKAILMQKEVLESMEVTDINKQKLDILNKEIKSWQK